MSTSFELIREVARRCVQQLSRAMTHRDVGLGGPARKAGQGAWASAGLDCDMTAHLLPLVSEDLEAQLVLLRDEVKAQMGFIGFCTLPLSRLMASVHAFQTAIPSAKHFCQLLGIVMVLKETHQARAGSVS